MELGYIQSHKFVFWNKKKRQLPFVHKEDDVLIPCAWGDETSGQAYLCRGCRKIILSLPEEANEAQKKE